MNSWMLARTSKLVVNQGTVKHNTSRRQTVPVRAYVSTTAGLSEVARAVPLPSGGLGTLNTLR